MIEYPLPLLGFAAYSGTGKTTLLRQLLPLLRDKGLRVAVVKHAHHLFEIDHPNKDSYELRKAGAVQMLIGSRRRIALVTELEESHGEPTLREMLGLLDPQRVDLVLVEGFKREAFPKIELHRPSLGKPLLCTDDPHIVALASDAPVNAVPANIVHLDLNAPEQIAGFIQEHMQRFRGNGRHDASH